MNTLKIPPLQYRDLLITECDYTKTEANEYVKMKLMNQFGKIEKDLLKLLEEK